MSRKQQDLEYKETDENYNKGFTIRVKKAEVKELVDTGKWRKVADRPFGMIGERK